MRFYMDIVRRRLNMTRMMPCLIPAHVVLIWSVFMLFVSVTDANSACQRRVIRLVIDHSNCRPRIVMTFACKGTCTSYVRPSAESPGQLDHFCQCCDADDVAFRQAVVLCPNMDWMPGRPRVRRIRVNMNLPTSCRCRPCSERPETIVTTENNIWHNRKRFASFNERLNVNVSAASMTSPGHEDNPRFMGFSENWPDMAYLKQPFIYIEDENLTYTLNEIY